MIKQPDTSGMVVNSSPTDNLSRLTKAEHHQMLVEWNDTQTPLPEKICFHQLFEEQVERSPDAVAVVFRDKHLSYQELNSRANQLAHYLQRLGVKPDVLVGIYMERSLEMMVALLGIFKAGGAYVPLDINYPKDRIGYILDDTQVPVLLSQEHLIDNLPEYTAHLLNLDSDWPIIARESVENPFSHVTGDNLAYIAYTSGSTGKPKGVMNTHRGHTNYALWCTKGYNIESGKGSLVQSPIAFDFTNTTIFPPLLVGRSVTLVPDGNEIEALVSILRSRPDFSLVKITPAHLVLLNQLMSPTEMAGSTQALVVAADQLIGERLTTWQKYAPDTVLYNEYGPTETVAGCSAYRIGPDEQLTGPVSIGRPISNTYFYVLDNQLQPVPIGAPGELYIGGVGVARGYLNRPELTAKVFISDHFSDQPDARMYKTGDLVRYLPDGNLIFLGRIDHQIKIRGFRVELGEIEAVLGQHPAVSKSAVIVREDSPGDKRLVAYIVPELQETGLLREVRRFLKEKVPEYMIPSAFVLLDKLPLTSNGKLDREALPLPDQVRPELDSTIVAPRTPVEQRITAIWKDVLGMEQIGVHDNFFELGGHSLLATQVITRVRQAFQAEIPLGDFFDVPTVAGLATYLEENDITKPIRLMPPILPITPHTERKLSFAQQRLWFVDQLKPGTFTYNIPVAWRMVGLLNQTVLEKSLDEIIRRHESLRTTFSSTEGRPIQVISPPKTIKLSMTDLSELPEAKREMEARRLAAEEAQRPFDLARGPLLRAVLYRLSGKEHILLLTFHHIVTDGWSTGVFSHELAVLYEAFSTGKPSPLAELSIQYADFALWQRQHLQSEALEPLLSYWKQQLSDAPPLLELPTDRPRPAVQSNKGRTQSFLLPLSLSEKLSRLGQQEGATLFMTLLAAYQTLLYRYSGQEDILVGTPVANRTHPEIERLIGFFVNTLVLRTDLSGDPTFRELLNRIRQVALGAYEHQELPFEKLVEELQPERNLGHSPIFQVMFAMQNTPTFIPEMTSLKLTLMPEIDIKNSMFDLVFSIDETEQGAQGILQYNTDLFDDVTIARMAGHFQVLLEAVVADPDLQISELPLLTERERHQLLVEWNGTKTDYPENTSFFQFFEEQVEQSPDAVAVVFGDKQLTYRELNNKANQTARYLQARGVGPEVMVGICVERSLEMIVGIMGILKAGGAYLPMDPSYPNERLAYMLEDSQAQILLTKKHLLKEVPDNQAQIVYIDDDWQTIAYQNQENPTSEVSPENLAYVIYTSGSTGMPKGVMITHRNLLISTLARKEQYDVPIERYMLLSSFAFDVSVGGIFWTLLDGGTLVLPAQDEEKDIRQLAKIIAKEQVTHILTVPSLYKLLLSEVPRHSLESLQAVIMGGEAYPPDLEKMHYDLLPRCALYNEYGPTEATVWSTVYEVPRVSDGRPVLIGRPIANTKIYILDTKMNPLPIGLPGELYIGGEGLARGYLNRPELTAEKFIGNPFDDDASSRLYRTGDLARYLPDGNIEFLGRIDHQVKIRGFRIELGEIEAILEQHPAVINGLAIVHGEETMGKQIVAYVIFRQGHETTVNEIRGYLKERLPDYMVPSTFVTLDTIPLTPNGKIDRKALPIPDINRPDLDANFVPPETQTEKKIAEIWVKLLNIKEVGVHDNFFELGGHSLLATQVLTRLTIIFQLEIPVRMVFECPTILEMANYIDTVRETMNDLEVVPEIAENDREGLEL